VLLQAVRRALFVLSYSVVLWEYQMEVAEMIVHILGTKSLFTEDYYKLICESPDHKDHWFITGMPQHPVWKEGQAGRVVGSKGLRMVLALYRSEGIVVHGLINPTVLLLLACQPWLLGKVNWVVWGGDLYVHRSAQDSIRNRLLDLVRRFTLSRVGFVTTLIEGEYKLAREWYGVRGIPLRASYPVKLQQSAMFEEPRPRTLDNREVSILVGNSATETNHHKEALDYLSHFRNERVRIVIPLSYGFNDYESYAEGVTKYAQQRFDGRSVCALTERMPSDSYTAILRDIDVGVFNNDRQQGMGSIFQLMCLGAKIYLRKGTLMWDHYKSLGCAVYDINEISSLTLSEFINQSEDNRQRNFRIMTQRNDSDVKIKQWQDVFTQMRKQRSEIMTHSRWRHGLE